MQGQPPQFYPSISTKDTRSRQELNPVTGLENLNPPADRRATARDPVHQPRYKVADSRKSYETKQKSSVPKSPTIQTDNQALRSTHTSAVTYLPSNSCHQTSLSFQLYDGGLNALPVDTATVAAPLPLTEDYAKAFANRVDRFTMAGPPVVVQDLKQMGDSLNKSSKRDYRSSAPPTTRIADQSGPVQVTKSGTQVASNSQHKIAGRNGQQLNVTETSTKITSTLQPVPVTPPLSNDRPSVATNDRSTKALPDFTQPHQGPYVGLYNHGNTCYMSVIFQCLRFTPSFFNICRLADKTNPSRKLVQCVATLLEYMDQQAGHKELYDAVETIRAELSHVAPHYKESDQQDAVEFLLCLLDSLHSELKSVTMSTSPEPSETQIPHDRTSTPKLLEQTSVDVPSEASSSDNGYVRNGVVPVPSTPNSTTLSVTKKSGHSFSKLFRKKLRRKSNAKKSCDASSTNFYDQPPSENKPSNCELIEGVHPAVIAWDKENMIESSPIKDTFMGQLQTYRECQECKCETVSYGVVWNLSVPIPNVTQTNNAACPTPNVDMGPQHSVLPHDTMDATGSRIPVPRTTEQFQPMPERNIQLFDGSSKPGGNTWPSRNDNAVTSLVHTSGGHASPTGDTKSRQAQSTFYTPNPPRPPAQPLQPRRVSLADCLKGHVLLELLDGSNRPQCQRCRKKTPCRLQSSLSRLPDVLVIHLLRFHLDGKHSKNTINVTFEMKLDMSEYMTSEYDKRHRFQPVHREENDQLYWLYAVVYHEGVMNYGHYTAACRIVTLADDQSSVVERWYQFDDEFVREIKPELVNRASAYLLFYERDSIYKQRLAEAQATLRKKRGSCILSQTTTDVTHL